MRSCRYCLGRFWWREGDGNPSHCPFDGKMLHRTTVRGGTNWFQITKTEEAAPA